MTFVREGQPNTYSKLEHTSNNMEAYLHIAQINNVFISCQCVVVFVQQL